MTIKDPAMLGGTNYLRAKLDHYPTPPRVTEALLKIIEDDLGAMNFWEPFVGNGAMYNILAPAARNAGSSDITAYDGFDPNGLIDFFKVFTDGDPRYDEALKAYNPQKDVPGPMTMTDIENLLGFRPDCIISNPPYGKLAEKSVRKALELMKPEHGYVCLLMRHEWDTAKTRADLFDHPAFCCKITLRFRPIWVEKKPGEKHASPRFSYAWYVWDFVKANKAPNAKPEIIYAN